MLTHDILFSLKDESLPSVATWMGHEDITLIRQMEKDKYHTTSHVWNRKKQNRNKLINVDNRRVAIRWEESGGRAKWEKGVECVVRDGNYTAGGQHARWKCIQMPTDNVAHLSTM